MHARLRSLLSTAGSSSGRIMAERNRAGGRRREDLTNSKRVLGLVMLWTCKTLNFEIESHRVENRAGNSTEMFGEGCDGRIRTERW